VAPAAITKMIASTTSSSINVKAREYFFFIGGISLMKGHDIRLEPRAKAKKSCESKIA
jgi:hypothetical protein